MRRRHGRMNQYVMAALAVVALVMFAVVSRSARPVRARFYDEKLVAARLARRATTAVAGLRGELGVPVDSVNDPNGTGLVGVQHSVLTWGRSDLSDALTTLNPNFAAALVELLHRAGLRSGDTVGLSWDGTYPGLNIALLAACSSVGARPVVVTAASAASWGANYPGMSWLDIEARLRQSGVWGYRSRFATSGGESDDGRGLVPEGRDLAAAAAAAASVDFLVPADPAEGAATRVAAFRNARAVVCVGRVAADIGGPDARLATRVHRRPVATIDSSSTIFALLERRVPVLYLGNPRRVATEFRLPLAPEPLPEPGRGRLFFERRYPAGLAAALALVLLGLLLFVVRYDVEWYLGDRDGRTREEAV
ncbi:MAG: poly-gamma-glutamate system protein [bacterium]